VSEIAERAGVLVLHAWWGLNDDVRARADALRREGYAVISPDMYEGRVATTREQAKAFAGKLDEARTTTLLEAALADLGGTAARVGIVGWSMGAFSGAQLAQSHAKAVAAFVGYYGGVDAFDAAKPMPPVLAQYAETDEFESLDGARKAERDLVAAGRDAKLHVYPGTKHWFDEPSRPEFDKAASALAWDRTREFLKRHLRP
jgi:carboxymethylenebutenolidase